MSDGPYRRDASSVADETAALQLMERVRDGDASAFAELLALYWHPLVAYGSGLLDSVDAAEDIVQDAFVRLWARRAEWQARGPVRSYLYRITRNLALNERRRRKVHGMWLANRHSEPTRRNPTPLEIVEADEVESAFEQAMAALPPRRREVFVLARYHHLSYHQIAEVLQVSRQTVANQMSAALAMLRVALANVMDEASRAK